MEENIYSMENTRSAGEDLHVNRTAELFLQQGAKWARFIAIIGFVACGFMAILALTAGAWMSVLRSMADYGDMYAMGSAIPVTIGYLIGAVIYFFMALYLYRFATKTRQALATRRESDLTEAFVNLKNMFQLYGIIVIIALIFVGLLFLIAIFTGIAGAL